MTAVTFAVVHHLQPLRCKRIPQPIFNLLTSGHFFALPPSLYLVAV